MLDAGVVVVSAPAKINLYLHVLGRRSDGYHELDSLVMFAEIGDRLTLSPADQLTLTVEGRFATALASEPLQQNLVFRAAEALGRALDRAPLIRLTLDKELPVASGIGGGSADAAAGLRGLAELWQVSLDHPALIAVAAGLGADVPVCLTGGAAYFGGIGEIVTPAPGLPDCPAVLVNPGLPLPTPAVFKARTGEFSIAARLERRPADATDLALLLESRRNDLTAPAIALLPAVAAVLKELAATTGCRLARLSGSGATCFGLFATDAEAAAAAERIGEHEPSWWVRATRLVGGTG